MCHGGQTVVGKSVAYEFGLLEIVYREFADAGEYEEGAGHDAGGGGGNASPTGDAGTKQAAAGGGLQEASDAVRDVHDFP